MAARLRHRARRGRTVTRMAGDLFVVAFLLLGTAMLVWMFRSLWAERRGPVPPGDADLGIDEAELARAEEEVRRDRRLREPDREGGMPPGGTVGF